MIKKNTIILKVEEIILNVYVYLTKVRCIKPYFIHLKME